MTRSQPRTGVVARGLRLLSAIALLVATIAVWAPAHASAADASGAVTKNVTEERHYVNADGTKTVVDPSRTVSVTVDQTSNLRSLQLIHLSWKGARPTAGIVGDQNSDLAQNEEYPMVLLECRGVDSTSVPAAQRLSPRTCWTQFADERFSYGYDPYPAWRSDGEASPADRAAFVGSPGASQLTTQCTNILLGTANQHWLPFDGADGTSYFGGPFGCAGQAPEAAPANLSSLALPSNETFGVTGLDGTGQASFDVFTGEDHNSMGCSQTVACSLVAIPVVGIDCDSTGALLGAGNQLGPDDAADAQANCEVTGKFKPGQSIPSGLSGQDAVDGTLWWSASNWANRISFPLTFAPPDNACGLSGSGTPEDVYGSELMIQATIQWAPSFCLDPKLFNFNHVQTPEPQAANLLNTGAINAAFISRPPDGGFTNPTVTAPVAVTGFGIAFAVDDTNRNQVVTLKLDARLIAKLLTESYPSTPFDQSDHTGLENNPLNITFDPEFQALNPGIPAKIEDQRAALLSLSSDSDVLYALTSYINADPEARKWLDGTADPWGMTVNPAYKGISLPTASWPLLDSFAPKVDFGINPCLYTNPVPYLPLVASPTSRLFSIGQDMQFAIAQSQTMCVTPSPDPNSLAGAKLVAQGRQLVGSRFMLGIVSMGDAAREGLHLASLETQSTVSPDTKITDDSGRTFVTPSDASLKAAAALLKPNTTTNTWTLPYDTLRSSGPNAYPGTMVVYAAVPTKGLKAPDAANYGKLLTFAAGSGQQPGTGEGKLADGFLPMTSANNLGALATYTTKAATAVTAQQGTVPSVSGGGSATSSGSTSSGSGAGAVGGSTTTGGQAGNGSSATTPSTPLSSPNSSSAPASGGNGTLSLSQSTAPRAANAGFTKRLSSGFGGLVLPLLVVIALAAGGGAALVQWQAKAARR